MMKKFLILFFGCLLVSFLVCDALYAMPGGCPNCTNAVLDCAETGVDCGGPDCITCAARCSNAVQDGDETGVDCGGVDCTPCPTCSDGILNQGETFIDCGGPCSGPPSTANAGSNQSVCATTATLAGNNPAVGSGTWTLISGSGTITSPGLFNSGLTALGAGPNVFRWTISIGACPDSWDEVTITRDLPPTAANAGSDQTVCATTADLNGNSAATGVGTWTLISGAGTITAPGNPLTDVSALGAGANVFRWTISNGSYTPSFDEVTITRDAPPSIAVAGGAQSICSSVTVSTFNGNNPAAGTGTWTLISGAGVITSPNTFNSGVTGLGMGENVFRWTIANGSCPDESFDEIVITRSVADCGETNCGDAIDNDGDGNTDCNDADCCGGGCPACNAVTVYLKGDIDINGDLTIVNGAFDVTANNRNINLAGNWDNSSPTADPFVEQNGIVTFDGGNAQTITNTASGTETYYNMTMAKSANDLTLNDDVRVDNLLTLTTGRIFTTTTDLLTLIDNATVTGASNNSFIHGPIEKIGDDNFVFPVGKGSDYQSIAITTSPALALTTDAYIGEYLLADPQLISINYDAGIDHISKCEYWTLDWSNGTPFSRVTLTWDGNSCGVTALPDLRVARYDGVIWRNHGNGGTTGNTAAGTVITADTVMSFSPFTLASVNANNPLGNTGLPIELLSFTGTNLGATNLLEWVTASEINNDYFTLERSRDGNQFDDEIARVNGAGNSNSPRNYSSVDEHPYAGINYYRLKQTDYDGNFDYSDIIALEVKNELSFTIQPNPATDRVEIVVEGKLETNVTIRIFNSTGQLVDARSFDDHHGRKLQMDISSLSSGLYVMTFFGNDRVIKSKFVKE